MFGKKKLPVLTDTHCTQLNLILKIAEVMFGVTARIKRYDFNTGRGQLHLSDQVQEFYFDVIDEKRYHLSPITVVDSVDVHHWTIVHLEDDGSVRIGDLTRIAHKREDGMPLWWVGTSATDRREVPLYP